MTFEEKGISAKRIKMVGGSSKDKIWPKIITDILCLDVLLPKNPEEDFAAKGAAIIAGWGAGLFSSINEGYEKLETSFKLIKPEKNNVEFYKSKYVLF
jgi:sugar (pentulose or hexulose) kinase